jgi:hypothetical protein
LKKELISSASRDLDDGNANRNSNVQLWSHCTRHGHPGRWQGKSGDHGITLMHKHDHGNLQRDGQHLWQFGVHCPAGELRQGMRGGE